MTVPVTDVVLVVDKPSGPTSFDVVRQVRRAARTRHVGHGGTLDPLASGVLPVCLGEATKLAPFLLEADKEYEVTVRLGLETDTDDAAGQETARRDPASVDARAVEQALAQFRGPIEQVPPAYSAIKRAGRPLYDYARAGEVVTVAPRPVVVHVLDLVRFDGPEAVSLYVRCSKGTYVRAIARDLGRALGVGGHVTALRRTRSGPFSLAEARPLADVLAALTTAELELPAVSLAAALGHLERRSVSDAVARDLRLGRRVPWTALGVLTVAPDPAARLEILDPAGALVAVAEPRGDGTVRTLRVFGIPH
jgi:tRNA pseudouridine55 synthase